MIKKITTIVLLTTFLALSFGQAAQGDILLDDRQIEDSGVFLEQEQELYDLLISEMMVNMAAIFDYNHSKYLEDYCDFTDNIFEEDLDCHDYQDLVPILDSILDSILLEEDVLDHYAMTNLIEASTDSQELELIQSEFDSLGSQAKAIVSMLSDYQDQAGEMDEPRSFMFSYILFSLQSYIGILEYLEGFLYGVLDIVT